MRVESSVRVDRDVVLATASYGITFVRLVIAVLGFVTILRGDASQQFAATSICLVMALDYFDGATFDKSRFSALKEWRIRRRIADSISDRLVIQIICLPMLIKNSSFLWLYLLIIGRELAISGYVAKEFSNKRLLYPRTISKLACAFVGFAVLSFITLPIGFTLVVALIMIVLSAVSLGDYRRRAHDYKVSVGLTAKSGGIEEIT